MNNEISPAGRLTLHRPQQAWHDGRGGDTSVMQVASFAGQEMMAVADEPAGFSLSYLGFHSKGHRSMDLAKAAAPEFARKVLERMSSLIVG